MLNVGDYVRGLAQHDLHAAVRQGEDELARSGLQLGDIVACGLEQRQRFLFQTALGQCDTHSIPAGCDLGTARACKLSATLSTSMPKPPAGISLPNLAHSAL